MDRQELFDRTVQRLDEIVRDGFDEYAALESSGLVRKLLIDESPLLHQVNRQRRRRVRFEVAGNVAYETELFKDGPMVWVPGAALSPRLSIMAHFTVRSLTLDQFLAHRAMFVAGHDVSVHDVIVQLAHIEGGVHAGTPKTDVEHLLQQANAQLGISGMGSVANSMQGIADVVVVALQPLVIHAPTETGEQ